jgi:Lysyl oxidase
MDTYNFATGDTEGGNYNDCGLSYQGISSSWTDLYEANLDDQWVILPPNTPGGVYYLKSQVNEYKIFYETNTENNTKWISLNIGALVNGQRTVSVIAQAPCDTECACYKSDCSSNTVVDDNSYLIEEDEE